MWIDLTHTTDKTANDIMALTDNIMVSHVGIRELINWKRNKPLALLKSISKKNGLIGLTPWVHLIGKEPDSFEKTIDFAIKNDLSNSICIGTDFGAPISSLPTNRSIFDLSEKIEKLPAYSEEIKWKNAFKFFEKILN
jgi:microsomal dipeptidase-like Zn-dependent dipeptidase